MCSAARGSRVGAGACRGSNGDVAALVPDDGGSLGLTEAAPEDSGAGLELPARFDARFFFEAGCFGPSCTMESLRDVASKWKKCALARASAIPKTLLAIERPRLASWVTLSKR
jgi:hypothetical protein